MIALIIWDDDLAMWDDDLVLLFSFSASSWFMLSFPLILLHGLLFPPGMDQKMKVAGAG